MIFLLAGGAQRRHRAAMKRAQRREDLEAAFAVLVTPFSREFNRSLICLGARVAEEHLAIAETFGEALDETRAWLGMKHVGDVDKPLGLCLDRADHARMLMAEAG